MVYQTFDKVEKAPTEKKRTDKGAPRPKNVAHGSGTKQQSETDCRHDPREGVEYAIPDHVDFDVGDGVFRDASRERVVNL